MYLKWKLVTKAIYAAKNPFFDLLMTFTTSNDFQIENVQL